MAVLTHARAAMIVALSAAWLVVSPPTAFTDQARLRAARSEQPLEDQVKAVFLFNFAKYVDWPDVRRGSSATIRLCIPANPTFLAVVQEAVRDEVVNGRPLTASGLEGLDGARGCDILYVGDPRSPDGAAWIKAVRGRQALTVGDGQLADGVVIAFVRDRNRLRFDVNREAAARRKLSISSRLLGLARRVEP